MLFCVCTEIWVDSRTDIEHQISINRYGNNNTIQALQAQLTTRGLDHSVRHQLWHLMEQPSNCHFWPNWVHCTFGVTRFVPMYWRRQVHNWGTNHLDIKMEEPSRWLKIYLFRRIDLATPLTNHVVCFSTMWYLLGMAPLSWALYIDWAVCDK